MMQKHAFSASSAVLLYLWKGKNIQRVLFASAAPHLFAAANTMLLLLFAQGRRGGVTNF